MSQRIHVLRLYRRSLKLSLDWCVHRYLWRGQAMYIRELFENNKNVLEPRLQRAIIKETEDLLEKWKHPDPYKAPTAPGGSKYERNIPAPILDPPVRYKDGFPKWDDPVTLLPPGGLPQHRSLHPKTARTAKEEPAYNLWGKASH